MKEFHVSKLLDPEPPRSGLMNELWAIQLRDGFISDENIQSLAKRFGLSFVEIEGVVTFYHFFQKKPTGKHVIYLNNSIAAEFKGYERIKEAFERETGATLGSVDRTGTFGLFNTPCIGLSDQEPSALIDFFPFNHLNVIKVKEIVNQLRQGATADSMYSVPDDNIRYLPPNNGSIFFNEFKTSESLENAFRLGDEGVISELKKSVLAGRGGAFFPAWLKWDSARKQKATPKYVVCNADEGEPGTFKDRVLMNNQAASMIEGMIIGGFTIGAAYGIIYLRGEYRWLKKKLEDTIDQYYKKSLLGKDAGGITGFNFDMRIQMGAGAYVCGEETALLESMEGKRGEPRTKWFFPVERGYLQKPTIINNVETFCAVARIIAMGSDAYCKRGIPGSPGTKVLSVSGDCRLPGIYEIDWGMTVAELLELCEADDPYYIQLSGPSGECISVKEKYKRISMLNLPGQNDVRCGGAFMIFNHHRDLTQVLLNYAEFFKHESCGICTPCRAGNFILERKLEKLKNGLAVADDLEDLKNWGNIMKASSQRVALLV